MGGKEQDGVIEILKRELSFLKNGGYRHPDRAQWRAQYIFEDSPTCLNFREPDKLWPCTYCPLFAYAPAESQEKSPPCRHIPLNNKGETLDSLYRTASPEEIEATVTAWLEKEIARLEQKQEGEASRAAGAS